MKNLIKYGFIAFIICSAVILVSFTKTSSSIKLASLFTDNMVIQQNDTLVIWGWSQEGTVIKAEATWGVKSNAITSIHGRWSIQIPTPKADNIEHSLNILTKDTLINIQNILLGEVWLCSGQSNMEMPLSGWLPNDPLKDSEKEIEEANYPDIRMFTVKRNKSFTLLEKCEGTWQVCNPENVPEFSATAYFFGRELQKKLNVPVGLIHSSWSGSPAQSWVEANFVENIIGYEDIKEQIAKATDKTSPYNQWLSSMKRKAQNEFIQHKEFNVVDNSFLGIMNPDYDDSAWDTLHTATMDKLFQRDNFNGMAWFRQEFTFNGNINDSLQINLGKVEDLNTTFINGIIVGRKEHWGGNNKEQIFSIPDGVLKKGKNTLAVRVIDVWEKGGLLSQPTMQTKRGDKIQTLSNNWKYLPTAILLNEDFYVLKSGFENRVNPEHDLLALHSHTPTVLYNAMIAPLIPYAIKGAIWYQGESNIGKSKQYHTLFPAVFNSWRSNWGIGDFPFYYVQLASFNYGSNKVAELREAQLETLNEKNVGMAVTLDIGSLSTIHPPNKQDVGKRLALWALAKDYGKNDLVYSGPLYKSVKFIDDRAIISFDHVGSGLYSPDESLSHFEIAGNDLAFQPAKAVIKDDKVVVHSHKVIDPKIVRYAWDDTAMPSLYNKEGLPASPFRTSKETRIGLDELYPTEELTLKYHTEWTRNHYKERIREFKKDPLNYGDIVFVGNSITEGGKDWSGKFRIPNIKNRGISGDVTDGVLKRLDEIDYFKPEAIFLLIGINDLFNLHYQKEIPSPEYVGNNILKIAKILSEKTPKTKMYVQTVLPTDKEFMKDNIIRVNEIIRSHEKEGYYKVIDLYCQFTNENGFIKPELTYDGTHLNDEGYKRWVALLNKQVFQ
jgi:sialate O-acetylesterase